MTLKVSTGSYSCSVCLKTHSLKGSEFILYGQTNQSVAGTAANLSCKMDGDAIQPLSLERPEAFSCGWVGLGYVNHTFELSTDLNEGSVSIDSIWYLPQALGYTPPEGSFVVLRHDDPSVFKDPSQWTVIDDDGVNALRVSSEAINSTLRVHFAGLLRPLVGSCPC